MTLLFNKSFQKPILKSMFKIPYLGSFLLNGYSEVINLYRQIPVLHMSPGIPNLRGSNRPFPVVEDFDGSYSEIEIDGSKFWSIFVADNVELAVKNCSDCAVLKLSLTTV